MTRIRAVLSDAGTDVWTDEALEPGTPVWQAAIETRIKTTKCLVVLLSPAAKDSHWVRAEISRARLENVDVVPVIVDGHREADVLPLGLENANWIDIRRNPADGLRRLVDTITRVQRSHSNLILLPPEVSASANEGPIADDYRWQRAGRVLRYYAGVKAAGIELTAPVALGDLLAFGRGDQGVVQRVESMERDRVRIARGQAGERVGIGVWRSVEPECLVERAIDARPATYVGTVTRFYSNLSVLGVRLDAPLAAGDRVEVRGPRTCFVQTVRSIQLNRQPVKTAAADSDVGVASILPASPGDRLYRVE